jgi:hypothetical protein
MPNSSQLRRPDANGDNIMGHQPSSMSAEIRFGNILEPVLCEVDDARIAVVAEHLQADPNLRELEVVPLTAAPELNERTLYAVVGDPARWHAVRLLIQQGKLAGDVPVTARVFLNREQWQRAGLVARFAEAVNATPVTIERLRRRSAARQWSPHDLLRYL